MQSVLHTIPMSKQRITTTQENTMNTNATPQVPALDGMTVLGFTTHPSPQTKETDSFAKGIGEIRQELFDLAIEGTYKVAGREFTIEKSAAEATRRGIILHGTRGAEYLLIKNVNYQNLYFLSNHKGLVTVGGNSWFTIDSRGHVAPVA